MERGRTMTGQQLKNAILALAVQGKLVPQDPKDRRSVNTADEASSRAKKLWKRRIFRSLPSTATKEPSATAIHPTPTCVYM